MLTGVDVKGRKIHSVVVSISICVIRVSVDISVDKSVLLSDVLMMCPPTHFVRLLIDQSIGGPSIDFCLSIGVSESPLVDWSGNAYFCLISY